MLYVCALWFAVLLPCLRSSPSSIAGASQTACCSFRHCTGNVLPVGPFDVVFSMVVCLIIGTGQLRLVADLDVVCGSAEHTPHMLIAFFFVALFSSTPTPPPYDRISYFPRGNPFLRVDFNFL